MVRDDERAGRPPACDHEVVAGRRCPVCQPESASQAMSAQLGKVTEVHLVNTAFGPAKLQETSKDRSFLIMRALPAPAPLVPYVDRDTVAGAYRIAPEHAMSLGSGVLRYPVLEVVPSLFLDDESRRSIEHQLRAAGLRLHVTEHTDVTEHMRRELDGGELLWKSHAANAFSLSRFVEELALARSSPRFDRVFLACLRDGSRHLLAVERTLASVMGMHPYFMRLDQRHAVRLRLACGQDTWIAQVP